MTREREVIRDKARKRPLIRDIVQDIVDGKTSPIKPGDGITKKVVRDLYHLDLGTLEFLHKTHKATEEQKP